MERDREREREEFDPFARLDFPDLERSLRRPRTMLNALSSTLIAVPTGLALVPLFSLLWMVLSRGLPRLSWSVLTETPPASLEVGGGFGNAILGTIVMVLLAAAIAVPAGVMTGLFLALSRERDRMADAVRLCAKLLTGLPSILAGVFAYGAVVLSMGGFSAHAGGVALALLMLPTIVLTSEEAIRMVPDRMREAALGMGTTTFQQVWYILLPNAAPGILTGIMLAVARAAGETAPLLFTALFSNYWLTQTGRLELNQPTASLAVLIYKFAGMPFENQTQLAWTAALVLVLLVLCANLIGKSLSNRTLQ